MSSKTAESWESHLAWMSGDGQRHFESASTNRLNSAHWTYAQDESINGWLSAQLSTIRARANYECRQNGIVLGMVNTHADDVVGRDGPTLQVISDDPQYNAALEEAWNNWFSAPTTDPEVSGVSLIKSWVRSLWKNGEFLARIVTDPLADGPIALRLLPTHPRLLGTPGSAAGTSDVFMGIRFNAFKRPVQYYIMDDDISGSTYSATYTVLPPDLVIHRFIIEEDGQLRGIPWLNTALQPAADLRDYDDQVQDAARQIADQSGILYTDHPDAQPWLAPESVNVQRRTIKTAPPGWKPFVYPATMPPVQYPDYRAERQRELGRPAQMPLATIRLDYSKYNYSSARLETQNYHTSICGLQQWISGTPRSTGTLNRLVDLVAAEMRFSDPRLLMKPDKVVYQWTWPQRPHVDPTKEANAEGIALGNGTITLIDALAARGTDLETHLERMRRVRDAFEAAGVPMPAWTGAAAEEPDTDDADTEDETEEAPADV